MKHLLESFFLTKELLSLHDNNIKERIIVDYNLRCTILTRSIEFEHFQSFFLEKDFKKWTTGDKWLIVNDHKLVYKSHNNPLLMYSEYLTFLDIEDIRIINRCLSRFANNFNILEQEQAQNNLVKPEVRNSNYKQLTFSL